LFVILVTVVIFAGIQKMKTRDVVYDPGSQVPAEEIDSVSPELEVDQEGFVEDSMKPLPEDGSANGSAVNSGAGDEDLVECTADAMVCPDGSAVGRTGPDCEFSACPKETITVSKLCTAAQKATEICTMEYAPVCGLVEVQCVTTPCNPVPQTFGNACGACAQGNVDSYTEGECSL